jgi:hypothetical protein
MLFNSIKIWFWNWFINELEYELTFQLIGSRQFLILKRVANIKIIRLRKPNPLTDKTQFSTDETIR